MANRVKRRGSNVVTDEDNYQYNKRLGRGGKPYYVCIATDLACRGRASCTDEGIAVCIQNHNHPPFIDQVDCKEFMDKLWEEVVSTDDTPKIIWRRVALNYPTAAGLKPFQKVERSMRLWRYEPHPPIPHTLEDYGQYINMDEWRKYREYPEGLWVVRTIAIDEMTSFTIIGDPGFINSREHIRILSIDATFKVCPPRPKKLQLLTIMGNIDAARIPLAWVLMKGRSQVAYSRVFETFRAEFAPALRPTEVHVDFESAIANAISETYPGINVINCYFHHTHAIYNRLKKSGGKRNIQKLADWRLARVMYRKLITMALLPANSIMAAFEWFVDNMPLDIWEFLQRICIYYGDTWLGRYGAESFSMHRLHERTNNYIEAYHLTLFQQLGKHPGIWSFTEKLKRLQIITRIEVNSLDAGIPVRRRREQRYVNREIVLDRLWNLYDNGEINIPRFLACTNHISEAFDNKMIISTAIDVDQFLEAPIHDRNIQPPNLAMGEIIIEGLGEDDPVPILDVNEANWNERFFIFQNLQQSLCPNCNRSILDIIALPCQHWFLCQTCTEANALECAEQQRAPMCFICRRECGAFQVIQIS